MAGGARCDIQRMEAPVGRRIWGAGQGRRPQTGAGPIPAARFTEGQSAATGPAHWHPPGHRTRGREPSKANRGWLRIGSSGKPAGGNGRHFGQELRRHESVGAACTPANARNSASGTFSHVLWIRWVLNNSFLLTSYKYSFKKNVKVWFWICVVFGRVCCLKLVAGLLIKFVQLFFHALPTGMEAWSGRGWHTLLPCLGKPFTPWSYLELTGTRTVPWQTVESSGRMGLSMEGLRWSFVDLVLAVGRRWVVILSLAQGQCSITMSPGGRGGGLPAGEAWPPGLTPPPPRGTRAPRLSVVGRRGLAVGEGWYPGLTSPRG